MYRFLDFIAVLGKNVFKKKYKLDFFLEKETNGKDSFILVIEESNFN